MKLKNTLLLVLSFPFFVKPVLAGNDLTVTCSEPQESGFCQVSPPNTPLFTETDAKPGLNFYQNITVNNTDPNDPCFLYLSASENGDSILKEVLNNLIKRGPLSLYDKTMLQLLNSPQPAFLEEIPADSTYVYDWRVNMDKNAGNDYQDLNLNFDISLTFQCGHEPEITPTPTPVVNPPDGIILNELMPAPPNDGDEWFEIYNTNNFAVTLENRQ
ncbi:lamin tail domain-containing protein, partial [Patescibacteria group bacterium]|nr:lamin tail domain-containing protein [Patescibacteria group bacterium]